MVEANTIPAFEAKIQALRELLVVSNDILSRAQTLLHELQAPQPDGMGGDLFPSVAPSSPLIFAEQWRKDDESLVNEVRRKLRRCGKMGARILLHLLDRPDTIVSDEELLRVSGGKTDSTKVVRVTICHLRRALAGEGIDGAIVTQRRGYALTRHGARAIVDVIAKARILPEAARNAAVYDTLPMSVAGSA